AFDVDGPPLTVDLGPFPTHHGVGRVHPRHIPGQVMGALVFGGGERVKRRVHTRQYEHPGGPVRHGALDVGVQTITDDKGTAGTGAAYAFFVQRTHRFARDDRFHAGGVLDHLDEGTVSGDDAPFAGGRGVGIARHVEHTSRHR